MENTFVEDFTARAVEQGIKTIEMPSETAAVAKTRLDGKSVAIGGVGGAILTATGMAIWNGIKAKPKAITDEIRNNPKVKEATKQKLIKQAEQHEKVLAEIYTKLEMLDDPVEEDVIEEAQDN